MKNEIIFASDLDNTLIYSHNNNNICVEYKEGEPLTFMTQKAFSDLEYIAQKINFIPVTTRSFEQYKRINLPYHKYAIVANGAVLVIDGEIDKKWYEQSEQIASEFMPDMLKYIDILQKDIYTCNFKARLVDNMFIFTKSNNTQATMQLLEEIVDKNKFTVSSLKQKIYVIPNVFNKGNAIKKLSIKMEMENEYLICAGDSELDLSMLLTAHKAIVPNGYLYNSENFVFAEKDKLFSEFVLEIVLNAIKNFETAQMPNKSFCEKVYECVKKIPYGKVATYGQIAMLCGTPKGSRAVGNALHKNPYKGIVPCHRVVNRLGSLAGNFGFGGQHIQKQLLEQEGVLVNGEYKVDLKKYGWIQMYPTNI